ncbi:hypothetical protein Aperf_G00000004516 [Anoplocephala perfoliata]
MSFRAPLQTRNLLDKLLRIDHAKGLAAKFMYKGQLAVLSNGSITSTLRGNLDEEMSNIDKFERLMPLNRVRPSVLVPIWKVSGFMLGITTALLGEKAIRTFNSAVETVVAEQYNHQIRELLADNPAAHTDLLEMLKRCRDKDLEQHDLINEDNFDLVTIGSVISAAEAVRQNSCNDRHQSS